MKEDKKFVHELHELHENFKKEREEFVHTCLPAGRDYTDFKKELKRQKAFFGDVF